MKPTTCLTLGILGLLALGPPTLDGASYILNGNYNAVFTLTPIPGDNTAVIQAAIDNSKPGDTITFAPGTYNISKPLILKNDRNYTGQNGTILQWTGGNDHLMKTSSDLAQNINVSGLTFAGAGLKFDAPATNVNVTGNTFRDFDNKDPNVGNGIFVAQGATNCQVASNTFKNIPTGNGIYFYSADGSHFDKNTFDNVGEGIHGVWFTDGANNTVSGNTGTGISRFFIELQTGPDGTTTDLTVDGNRVSDWRAQKAGADDSHIALSIATANGKNVNITNNVIIGNGDFPKNPDYRYTAIEGMGDNLNISGNFAANWGWGQLVGHTSNWSTTNNTWAQIGDKTLVSEAGYGAPPKTNEGNTAPTRWDGKIPPPKSTPSPTPAPNP